MSVGPIEIISEYYCESTSPQ